MSAWDPRWRITLPDGGVEVRPCAGVGPHDDWDAAALDRATSGWDTRVGAMIELRDLSQRGHDGNGLVLARSTVVAS